MINYLKGIVTDIIGNMVTIEVNNIGYQVHVGNPFYYKINSDYKIYVKDIIRDENYLLYGFKTLEDKVLFEKLISVSGVGPKTAISLFSFDDTNKIILAIDNSDYKFLTKFPGIGNKTAQQIILDLKGKIDFATKIESNYNSKIIEVKEALLSLGFKSKEINDVLKNIDNDLSTEELLKLSLQNLVK